MVDSRQGTNFWQLVFKSFYKPDSIIEASVSFDNGLEAIIIS